MESKHCQDLMEKNAKRSVDSSTTAKSLKRSLAPTVQPFSNSDDQYDSQRSAGPMSIGTCKELKIAMQINQPTMEVCPPVLYLDQDHMADLVH
jgi:hypothetical protein